MRRFTHSLFKKIQISSGFDQLATREKIILVIGSLFILVVLFLQFLLFPYVDARSRIQNSLIKKQSDLHMLVQLQKEYRNLQLKEGGIKQTLGQRASTFSLFSFIDKQAEVSHVKKQIKYMKPSTVENDGILDESIVDMKLQDITMEKLVQFIRLIESEENVVSIRRLSIQTSAKKMGYLDVNLQIITFLDSA